MNYKFILQQFNENQKLENEKPVKTFKEIAKILNIDYFQARQLYLHCKNNSKAHSFVKGIANKFRIVDNPELYNRPNVLC
jgi:hypothetical protein